MSDALNIPSQPHGIVWLFRVDLPARDIDTFTQETYLSDDNIDWPLADALGISPDHDFIEVFDVADLKDYGFARYLSEANGFDDSDLSDDADMLDALTGHVLLVFSQSLPRAGGRFTPKPPLEFIARYERKPDIPSFDDVESESAAGMLPQGKPPKSDARMSGMVATVVLIFLALFVAAFVWVGG